MKKISLLIKIAVITVIIGICTIKLWNIASIYTGANDLRDELEKYVCERDETFYVVEHTVYSGEMRKNDIVSEIINEPALPEDDNEINIIAGEIGIPAQETVVNPFINELQNIVNSDITGWLYIPGTKIDYPVVSINDNDFYLRHDVNKKESDTGSIFTDYRCAADFTGFNTVIYGHNMKNRSMFGSLRSYADIDFFDENRRGALYTSTKTYSLEIFAYMVISSDNPQIYANPESKDEFLEYIKENACTYREPENNASGRGVEKVLTMSTCAYEFEDSRIVVLASIY